MAHKRRASKKGDVLKTRDVTPGRSKEARRRVDLEENIGFKRQEKDRDREERKKKKRRKEGKLSFIPNIGAAKGIAKTITGDEEGAKEEFRKGRIGAEVISAATGVAGLVRGGIKAAGRVALKKVSTKITNQGSQIATGDVLAGQA